MFRLIKLGLYLMLGYFIYEMCMGIIMGSPTSQQRGQSRRGGQPSRRAGRGRQVRTEESDGGSETHTVGRGVIS